MLMSDQGFKINVNLKSVKCRGFWYFAFGGVHTSKIDVNEEAALCDNNA